MKQELGIVGTISTCTAKRQIVRHGDGTDIHSVGKVHLQEGEDVVTYQPFVIYLINPIYYGSNTCPKTEGTTDMSYHTSYEIQSTNTNTNKTTDADREYARKCLMSALDDSYFKGTKNLRKKFHIHEDATPKTIKELKEKLKKGEYKLDENEDWSEPEMTEETEFDYFANMMERIIWTDPSRIPDKKGYKIALDNCEKLYQDCRIEIKVLDSEKGLESLKKFQITYH